MFRINLIKKINNLMFYLSWENVIYHFQERVFYLFIYFSSLLVWICKLRPRTSRSKKLWINSMGTNKVSQPIFMLSLN